MSLSFDVGRPVNITATGPVCTRDCALIGFYVNSTTGGTLVLRTGAQGTSSGTAIGGTITPAIGWNALPVTCNNGLHATVANTIDVTFVVVESPV